ncbi:hypothetical protein [Leptospira kmetyi]|uniref:hypothetical protein n=1 Tax=Leptospira kmetyi TaxID=408139 RepID=UPI001FAFC633|nr:hypothetical protein [Leptospira kmetyi]
MQFGLFKIADSEVEADENFNPKELIGVPTCPLAKEVEMTILISEGQIDDAWASPNISILVSSFLSLPSSQDTNRKSEVSKISCLIFIYFSFKKV